MHDEWAEKYRPRSLSEIIGNEHAVRAMRRWADSWRNGVPRVKALVLRGEPGTGKTSSALALARDYDWDIVEMNASDHRNAESIKMVAGMGSRGQTFTSEGEFLSSKEGRRKLIILDEADNLFGREDHGGAKAIVETIQASGQPVILIVNDYYELTRKASALKKMTDSAVFRRLDPRSTTELLLSIAGKEGVTVDRELVQKIARNAAGDLRAAVNDLQMLVQGRSALAGEDLSVLSERNQEIGLSEALDQMFSASTVRGAQDATMGLDKMPDELEKWIEESIPREMSNPEDLARAFDALSKADIYLKRTRLLQHYGLWAYARTMMTAGVALAREHSPRSRGSDYRFPSHFIVMSRAKGANAARESLKIKLSPIFHTSGRSFYESILPALVQLCRRDRRIALRLAERGELDEGDVAYLLQRESDSQEVSSLLAEVRASKGDGAEKSAAPRRPRSKGRALGDF